jgi:ATP-dependent helicase/nuclease subunit B
MFDPTDRPRLFALPPGADFARELVLGLKSRLADHPPDAMARVELFLNTRRMQRRVESVFDSLGAGFLPRIRLITDLADPVDRASLPRPTPALRRQLELAELVRKLIDADPSLAPRSAVYDLAQSLGALLDEMQAEGVTPEDIANLDVTDQSGHWERAQRFLNIVTRYFDPDSDTPDAATVDRTARAPRHHCGIDRIARFGLSVDDSRRIPSAGRSCSSGFRLGHARINLGCAAQQRA